MELHASNDQTFGSRASIERYLAPVPNGERLVWQDQLLWRDDNKWGSRSRIERGDGSIAVREGDASDFCWAPKAATWLSRPAFELATEPSRGWRRFQGLPVSFDLSALIPCANAAATLQSLLGTADLGRNGFVRSEWEGWSLLCPTMTLLSAMTAPSLPIFNVLMSPVGQGVMLDLKASTPDCLALVRTYGFALVPYRPRAYECLGFWLEDSRRRFSLQRTYRSIIQNKPLELPVTSAQVDLLAEGYTDGERLVVQRLGANQEQRIWPRSWRQLVIRCVFRSNRHRIPIQTGSAFRFNSAPQSDSSRQFAPIQTGRVSRGRVVHGGGRASPATNARPPRWATRVQRSSMAVRRLGARALPRRGAARHTQRLPALLAFATARRPRIDSSPWSAILCEPVTNRSRIASATVGLPPLR